MRVIDGDTIEVAIAVSASSRTENVRYIGINTPETGQPCAAEATAANLRLVEGKDIRLEKDISDRDRYGRLLRYVYVDSAFVNAELVRSGYAQAATYPPDVKHQSLFLQLQGEARSAGQGCWAATASPTPGTMPTPPAGQASVRITCIFYDGVVPSVESDEYVEIRNYGSAPQDLEGWVLRDVDEGYPSFTFPHHVLQPGASVRLYTNEYHPECGGFSFGSGKAVWNNSNPDTAALYNALGQEVSRKTYPPGC